MGIVKCERFILGVRVRLGATPFRDVVIRTITGSAQYPGRTYWDEAVFHDGDLIGMLRKAPKPVSTRLLRGTGTGRLLGRAYGYIVFTPDARNVDTVGTRGQAVARLLAIRETS